VNDVKEQYVDLNGDILGDLSTRNSCEDLLEKLYSESFCYQLEIKIKHPPSHPAILSIGVPKS